jgi:hypothetical protein
LERQLERNIGLTDRQHELAKQKIRLYKDELALMGFNDLEESLVTLKIPLRQIDRSKFIEIVDSNDDDRLSTKGGKLTNWIKIGFPFNKKTIQAVDALAKEDRRSYHHTSGSHNHYFILTEPLIEKVISTFLNRNFIIDPALIIMADEISAIRANMQDYVPGLYSNVLKNVRPKAAEFIASELNEDDPYYALKLSDRRGRYGLEHVDVDDMPVDLLGEIVFRDRIEVVVDPELHSISALANVVNTLGRLPLLVLVDDNDALDQVKLVHEAFPDVSDSDQSVLFRVKSSGKYSVNNYIKDNNLNNWVDKTTKIVYISKSKLPKVLLNSKWQPMCVLGHRSARPHSHVSTFVRSTSDLVITLGNEHKNGRKTNNEFV